LIFTYTFSFGPVESCSKRVEFVHRLVLVLYHKPEERILVVENLLSRLLMLLDGVGEVSATLLLKFHLLSTHVNRVLFVELNLVGSHKWLHIVLLLGIVRFHM